MSNSIVILIICALVGVIIMQMVMLVLFLSRKPEKNDSANVEMVERLGRFETNILESMNTKLSEDSKEVNKTILDVMQRLTTIDNAQKQMADLSSNVGQLQSILTDKKTRGIYGETTLKHVVENVLGHNDKLYQLQYTIPCDSEEKRIADCMIFAPEPIGMLAVDSKFPLENYQKMMQADNETEQARLSKLFEADTKKHINAIADKYIIPNVTAEEAIMFLPAEAIFAEINAYHPELLDYAASRHVWVCSPTTLMATLTTIQMAVKNIEQNKNAAKLQQELNKLSDEFKRYEQRWSNLAGHMNTIQKDVKEINTTTDKISKRFKAIEKVKLDVDVIDTEMIEGSDLIEVTEGEENE